MRLTHGSDWKGEICGQDTAVLAKKYMMFCGSPERTEKFPKFILMGSTVCVDSCPNNVDFKNVDKRLECLMPAFHNFSSYQGGEIGTIPNVQTLEMTLTQSVTYQNAYPTEAYGGRFCLPSKEDGGLALRDQIIMGPWGQYYRPLVSAGGLMDSWPLLAMSAGLAVLLGFLYLTVMTSAGGLLIFVSMIASTLFTLAAGIFLFLAIVMDMDDTSNLYGKFNPILSVYVGDEAKVYSIVTGVILILLGIIFGCFTMTSMTHIDECIGLIDAACEPFRESGNWILWIYPLVSGVLFFVLAFGFGLYGLPIVASLGALDHSEISINGVSVQGLQRVWKKDWIQHAELWYYCIGMVFLLEFYLQLGHYFISYVISCWYFIEVKEVKANNNKLLEKAAMGGKKVEVRVAGVDANYAPRRGTVVGGDGQKMLVVPVGKKGPGLGRNDLQLMKIVKTSHIGIPDLMSGIFTGLTTHLGSIALGTPVIFVFRPFRMVSQFVTAFLNRIADPTKGPAHSDDAHTSAVKSCTSLLSSCLEQVFGKYSKNAWTELILSGGGESGKDGFFECAENSFQRLVKSGGSVAHLHGAMLLYEFFGGMSITLICGWTIAILQDKLDMFNIECAPEVPPTAGQPTKVPCPFYIEDKNVSTAAAMIIAFAMAWSWMTVWAQAADVLLYCVSWNRLQVFQGEEHGMDEKSMIEPVKTYCPQNLRFLLPEHELEAHHEHGLHAHGIGQQGAILAAMEHGAMGGEGGGPDYGKSIAQTHAMATRLVG